MASRGESKPSGKGSTGRKGEELAAGHLVRQGCKILATNWQANPGEVDIIAQCPDAGGRSLLAFVEVRTRHGRAGLAEESISKRKAASMVSAAYAYMEAEQIDPEVTPWRIDLVAIALTGSTISHLNWVRGALDEGLLA
ncbi:MAG TPA: YraN family protein [Chloroflexia bacterium]|nr:YraN family protein [Chloroflexia bacterium]